MSMVVPMPTAKPLTAATMGLAAVLIISKNCWAGRGPPPAWVRLAKSVRSLPLVKESAVPVSRMTRMVSSVAAVCKACAISPYIAWVRAFFLPGRFIWMVRTPSRVVVRMSVVIWGIRYWLLVIRYLRRFFFLAALAFFFLAISCNRWRWFGSSGSVGSNSSSDSEDEETPRCV